MYLLINVRSEVFFEYIQKKTDRRPESFILFKIQILKRLISVFSSTYDHQRAAEYERENCAGHVGNVRPKLYASTSKTHLHLIYFFNNLIENLDKNGLHQKHYSTNLH